MVSLYLISIEHHKTIKQLSNDRFGCEQSTEVSMLLNIIGWDIETQHEKFDFYKIIEQVEASPLEEEYGLKEFKEYINDNLNLNNMQVDSRELKKTPKKIQSQKDIEMEEEKIDTSDSKPTEKLREIDPHMIPSALYLITPDYYFTLPKL